MSVSKRLRYEVLRRDNHACKYCGAVAPDAILTVDHVTPTALGGSDDPSNLVAACKDCNSGKSASNPDAPMVADVAQDALRWSQALQVAAQEMLDQLNERDDLCEEFRFSWNRWTLDGHRFPLPGNWKQSVVNFLSVGLPMAVLCDCIDLAMAAPNVKVEDRFRYTCGIAWRKVAELQTAAHQSLAAAALPPQDSSVSGSDLAAQAWGYLPDVDGARVAAWARAFRESRAEDEEEEHDFTQWSDDVCGLLGAISDLSDEYFAAASTVGMLLKKLPSELLDTCRREARRMYQVHELEPSSDDEIDRFALLQAVGRLVRAEQDSDACEKPCPFANVKNVEAPF